MAYDDLRDWIRALEKHGELKRIREEVSPELEITEITDRVSKIGAKPGRCQRKGRTTLPAARRCCLKTSRAIPATRFSSTSSAASAAWRWLSASSASTRSPSAFTGLMNVKAPEGLFDKLKMLPQLGALTSAFPKTVSAKDAPCKEVILKDNFDLN